MNRITTLSFALLAAPSASQAIAGPTCTDVPQTTWLSEAEMTKRFQAMGYKDDVKK